MTPDQVATVSAEMPAQRSAELAGDEAHYRLRNACVEHAVEMYEALKYLYDVVGVSPQIAQLIKEIDDAAK